MEDTAFLDCLWEWADTVLNTDLNLGITIILGEQNAARPKKPYVVIHRPVNTNREGRAYYGDVDATTEERCLTHHHSLMVSVEAVGLGSDYIRFLLDSTDTEWTKQCFTDSKITYLRSENVISVPDLQEDSWELRNVVDLHFLYAYERPEKVGYIETVQWTNNIR